MARQMTKQAATETAAPLQISTEKKRRGRRDAGAIYPYRTEGDKVLVYSGQVTLPYAADGVRRRKTVYGKTKKDVQAQIDRIKSGVLSSEDGSGEVVATEVSKTSEVLTTLAAPMRVLVSDLTKRWLETIVKPKLRATTYRSYEQMTRNHIDACLGAMEVSAVDDAVIDQFLIERQTMENPLAARSVQYLRSILHRQFRYAMKWRYIRHNPVELSDPIPDEKKAELVVTTEKAFALLDSFSGHRHEAEFTLALGVGMRICEILGLRWEDVVLDEDATKGTLTVRYQLQRIDGKFQMTEPKTAQGGREVSLPMFVVRSLVERRRIQDRHRSDKQASWANDFGLVFTDPLGNPLLYRTVYSRYKDLLAANGFSDLRLHDLRHFNISLLFGATNVRDKEISDRVGHKDPGFSRRKYTHVIPQARDNAARELDRLFDKRSLFFGGRDESL